MLSSISGHYFAGHNVPVGEVPVPFNDELQYIFPGSVFNNGSTVRSTTTVTYSVTAYPPYVTTSSTPTPAYMIFPDMVSATLNSYQASVSPSSDLQRTISVWMYIPTASVIANRTNVRLVTNETPDLTKGIKLRVSSDASKNLTLSVIMGSDTISNTTYTVPTLMPRDTWFMLTISYIMNNTYPTSVWFNDILAHQWTYGADTMPQVTYYLTVGMLSQWSVRFNNYQMLGVGMMPVDVSAKFAAERSYYGV